MRATHAVAILDEITSVVSEYALTWNERNTRDQGSNMSRGTRQPTMSFIITPLGFKIENAGMRVAVRLYSLSSMITDNTLYC